LPNIDLDSSEMANEGILVDSSVAQGSTPASGTRGSRASKTKAKLALAAQDNDSAQEEEPEAAPLKANPARSSRKRSSSDLDDELNEDASIPNPKKARTTRTEKSTKTSASRGATRGQKAAKTAPARRMKNAAVKESEPWDELDDIGGRKDEFQTKGKRKGSNIQNLRHESVQDDATESASDAEAGQDIVDTNSAEKLSQTISQSTSQQASTKRKTPASRTKRKKAPASFSKRPRAQSNRANKKWEAHNVVTDPKSPLVNASLTVCLLTLML
jgi:hypothetical protein